MEKHSTREKLLSIVIISKDEECNIRRCIQSVLSAIAPLNNVEVILVHSASTDATVDIAQEYPIRILQLNNSVRLRPAAGRHVGFQNSNGEHVFFLDGDSFLHKDWFVNALPYFYKDKRIGVLLGKRRETYVDESFSNSECTDFYGIITRVFMLQGLLIGLTGTAVGSVLGVALCWLLDTYRLIQLQPEVYSIPYVPFHVHFWDVVLVAVTAILISFLATLYPARSAAPGSTPSRSCARNSLLEVRGLSKSYKSGEQRLEVRRGIDLNVSAGEMVAVTGASGSGKSILLHLLGVMDRPDSGVLRIDGSDAASLAGPGLAAFRNRTLGFVFQFHYLLPEFTALENAMRPLLVRGVRREEAERRAAGLLAEVGLAPRGHHRPGELSGGEQQRVALARALH